MNTNSSIDIQHYGIQKLEELLKEVSNLKLSLDDNFSKVVEVLSHCNGKIIFCGVGKSGIIAQKAFASFTSTGNVSMCLNPLDAMHGDFGVILKGDCVVLISHSGNTKELLNLLPTLQHFNTTIISITSNEKSHLAVKSDYHLCTHVQKEICPHNLAPTTSTTSTLILLDLLMVSIMKEKGFKKEEFALFHPAGMLGKKLVLKVGNICDEEHSNCISSNCSFSDIVNAISTSKKGIIPVIENSNIIGIISDGDLRRSLDTFKEKIFQKSAQDLMTTYPKVCEFNDLAVEVLNTMEKYEITAIPVLKNNVFYGIINIHDILKEGF